MWLIMSEEKKKIYRESNKSEEEEIKFATGESDNLHDLMIAQQKAAISPQYTVAVKNAAVESYKTIMNMQF